MEALVLRFLDPQHLERRRIGLDAERFACGHADLAQQRLSRGVLNAFERLVRIYFGFSFSAAELMQ
jgi:hypothetical protein